MATKRKPSTKSRQWQGVPLDSKGRYNGKPVEHWERMATELVIDSLIRGSMLNTEHNPVARQASQRMLELAKAESPELFLKVLDERARCQAGLQAVVAAILSP